MKHKAIKTLGVLSIILSWLLFVLYVIACSMTQAELADISAKGYDTKHIFLAFLASFILGLLLYNMGSIGMQKDIREKERKAEIKKKLDMARFQMEKNKREEETK